MVLSDKAKGYLFAFASVIATSNVFVFSKAAMKDARLETFGFYWFLLGVIWNLFYNIYTGNIKQFRELTRRQFGILTILGILEVCGTTFFFLAIYTVPNPAIVSFLGNINPIFITILGLLILKEKYTPKEVMGIFLIILGAFVISYKGENRLEGFFIRGTEYVLLSAVFFGISAIVTKINVKVIKPTILALNRTAFLFIFSFVMLWANSIGFEVSQKAFFNILIGSILGPFLTVIAGYNAYKYLEVSRVSILGSTKGIFVLIGAYIYLNQFPQIYQIVGGLVSIVGVVLIALGKSRIKNRKLKINSID
jgi:drug/metabolite transporter (DMT)-like permease